MKIFAFILTCFWGLGAVIGPSSSDSTAGIRLDQKDDLLTIEPWFYHPGPDTVHYRYELKAVRAQPNGSRSSNTQGGDFSCAPGDTVVLSRQTINVDAGATCDLALKVMAKGESREVLFDIQQQYKAPPR